MTSKRQTLKIGKNILSMLRYLTNLYKKKSKKVSYSDILEHALKKTYPKQYNKFFEEKEDD